MIGPRLSESVTMIDMRSCVPKDLLFSKRGEGRVDQYDQVLINVFTPKAMVLWMDNASVSIFDDSLADYLQCVWRGFEGYFHLVVDGEWRICHRFELSMY